MARAQGARAQMALAFETVYGTAPASGGCVKPRMLPSIWYSAAALYVGVRAFEPHGAVNATLADRDAIFSDDNVQLLLDTFDDRRRALVFALNAYGIQADGVRDESEQASGGFFAAEAADREEAMARAYLSGGYSQARIARHFQVHYSTVSRAVRRFEQRAPASS